MLLLIAILWPNSTSYYDNFGASTMSFKQRKIIDFVGLHSGNFATPAFPGVGVWIYSIAVDRSGKLSLVRDLCDSHQQARNILGY